MERKLNILICGDDSAYYRHIAEELRCRNYRVRTCGMNEEFLLAALHAERPDILIMKHCTEGSLVFWALDPYTEMTVIFVYGRFEIISEAERIIFGGYCIHEGAMLEPILRDVRKQPIPCNKQHLVSKPEYLLTAMLGYFDVPYYTAGFHYLRAAVMLACTSQDFGSNMADIYPQIARQFATTSACVERAIRHAVSSALEQKDFPVESADDAQFANSRIVRQAAEWLLRCCKRYARPIVPRATASTIYTVPVK